MATHQGKSPIQCAIENHQTRFARLLLIHGACPNDALLSAARSAQGFSPLFPLLFFLGADAFCKDKDGPSPLELSLGRWGGPDPETSAFLEANNSAQA